MLLWTCSTSESSFMAYLVGFIPDTGTVSWKEKKIGAEKSFLLAPQEI